VDAQEKANMSFVVKAGLYSMDIRKGDGAKNSVGYQYFNL
jgi:hypothetical protein